MLKDFHFYTQKELDDLLALIEGTEILSTGEGGGTKFLREDGDGTCSWQPAAGGGVTRSGATTDHHLARWNGASADSIQESTIKVTDNGEMTNAFQPAFLAYNSVADDDVTGDGTIVNPVDFDTEVFDQGGNFAGGVLTAPVPGRLFTKVSVRVHDVAAGHSLAVLELFTSNGSHNLEVLHAGNCAGSNILVLHGVAFVDMDASDTAHVLLHIYNGAKVIDIDALRDNTYFAGALIC